MTEQKTDPPRARGPCPDCTRRYYRVQLAELAYLRFVLESYEGLAVLTSYPRRAEVELVIPPGREAEVEALLGALAAEITLVPIPRPADWPG